jgi:hypothetical protein
VYVAGGRVDGDGLVVEPPHADQRYGIDGAVRGDGHLEDVPVPPLEAIVAGR